MTRLFVDVAAVRIQRWLGRSSTLAGRRGASAALAAATSPKAVDTILADIPGAHRNTEAGHVDGVINVEVDSDDGIRPVIDACLAHLRGRLPAVELSAVWGSGPDYLSAYADEIKPRLSAGGAWQDLPVLADFPPLADCQLCRSSAAATLLRLDPDVPDEQHRACADCAVRHGRARHAVGGAEAVLRDKLTDGLFAAEFADLAVLPITVSGRTERLSGTGATHLATIYADGNAVGALLDHVAHAGRSIDKRDLAAQITAANIDSVADATLHVWDLDRSPYLPVTPHVLAGDDLLVSVPAAAAWPFLIHYATVYSTQLQKVAEQVPGAPAPSVSAGVVFAHSSHPFAEQVTLAADLLDRAKRAVRGRCASVTWLDLTVDGPRPARPRPCLTLADLEPGSILDRHLRRLAALPASQLAALAALAAPVPAAQRHTAATALARQVERLDLAAAEPFLEPAANPAGLDLHDALNLARWYP